MAGGSAGLSFGSALTISSGAGWTNATSETTRPLMFGYMRVHPLLGEEALAAAKAELHRFAASEGFTLGTVFVEDIHTAPAAFEALVSAIKHYEARAVVVPSLRHLAVLGAQPPLKEYLRSVTNAQVFVMQGHAP